MKKLVLIVLLPQFADWEASFTSAALNHQIQNQESKYIVKTVGVTSAPIKSIGGLSIIPDYTIENIPTDYSALLLIGGMSWCTEKRKQTDIAKKIIPMTQTAINKKIVVGAICDASTFLGANGWLNSVKHTSNTLNDLKKVSGEIYTNEKNYVEVQAIQDGNIVSANGTAYLEFTKEIMLALKAYSVEDIETHYDFYKNGYYESMKKHGIAKGI